MANRNFNNNQALEKEVKHLFAQIAIAGSGAPTLTSGLGIASIARNTNGDYTLTLDDSYNKLLHFHGILEDTSGKDIHFQVDTKDLAPSSKTITFYTLTAATPTDPGSGDILYLEVVVRNSSVGPA